MAPCEWRQAINRPVIGGFQRSPSGSMVPDAVGKALVRGWPKASLMPIRRLPIFFLSTTSRPPVHPAHKLNKRKPEGTRAPKTSLRFLFSGAISSRTGAAESNFPAQDTRCKQGGAFANRLSRDCRCRPGRWSVRTISTISICGRRSISLISRTPVGERCTVRR